MDAGAAEVHAETDSAVRPGLHLGVGEVRHAVCERMHRDIARVWDVALAVWAGEGVPAFGRYGRQAPIADWKAGLFTSTPFTVVLFGVCWIWRARRPPVGSGKLETPCDRMQDANSSVLPLLASELWPPDAFVAVPLGLDEPHAASPKAAASRLMMIVNRMGASLPGRLREQVLRNRVVTG
jgi:hypothetical protein